MLVNFIEKINIKILLLIKVMIHQPASSYYDDQVGESVKFFNGIIWSSFPFLKKS